VHYLYEVTPVTGMALGLEVVKKPFVRFPFSCTSNCTFELILFRREVEKGK